MNHRLPAALTLFTLLLCASPLGAEEPADRLTRLHSALDADERAVKLWWFGWAGIVGGAAIGQTGLSVLTHDAGFRSDLQTGAVTSWLGMAGLALVPVRPLQRWDSLLDAPIELQMRQAEAELRDRAKRELQVGGWLGHTLNALVGLSAGSYLWFHEDRRATAVVTGIMDILMGELQFWTVPHTAVHALAAIDAEE